MITIVGCGVVATQTLVAGVQPTLHDLDAMSGIGPFLYTMSSSKWLVEGFVVDERDASPPGKPPTISKKKKKKKKKKK